MTGDTSSSLKDGRLQSEDMHGGGPQALSLPREHSYASSGGLSSPTGDHPDNEFTFGFGAGKKAAAALKLALLAANTTPTASVAAASDADGSAPMNKVSQATPGTEFRRASDSPASTPRGGSGDVSPRGGSGDFSDETDFTLGFAAGRAAGVALKKALAKSASRYAPPQHEGAAQPPLHRPSLDTSEGGAPPPASSAAVLATASVASTGAARGSGAGVSSGKTKRPERTEALRLDEQ